MPMKHKMVEVILYKDGTWEIKHIDSRYATQKAFGSIGGRSCILYRCEKEKAYYYLQKLFKELIAETNAEIRNLIGRRDALSAQLQDFEENMEGDTQ